jgi:hypothetical protein
MLIRVFLALKPPWHGQCTASIVMAALLPLFSTATISYKDQCCTSAPNFMTSTIFKDWNFNLFDNPPLFYICFLQVRLPEDDVKIEICRSVCGLYVKVYISILVYLLVLSVETFITAHTCIWILIRLQIVTRFVHCLTGTINTSRRMLQVFSIRFSERKLLQKSLHC